MQLGWSTTRTEEQSLTEGEAGTDTGTKWKSAYADMHGYRHELKDTEKGWRFAVTPLDEDTLDEASSGVSTIDKV